MELMEGNKLVSFEKLLGDSSAEVFTVRWNLEDNLLAAGMGDGTVRVYNPASGSLVSNYITRQGELQHPVTSLRFRPNLAGAKTRNVIVAITSEGVIVHLHASTGKLLHQITLEENPIYSMDFSGDGRYFALGCRDTTIRVYDEATKQMTMELDSKGGLRQGHGNRIFSLKWLDENTIVSGGWDRNLLLWDIRTQSAARSIYGPYVCGDAIDFRGGVICAGSYMPTDQLNFFLISEARLLRSYNLKGFDRPCMVYTVQFSRNDDKGCLVAAGVGGNEAYFYESDTMRLLGALDDIPRGVYSADFAYSDNRVALGCGDGSIRIVRISPRP